MTDDRNTRDKKPGNGDGGETKGAEGLKAYTESEELANRMGRIKRKLMILSGKGGVGKSTVAVNVAVALAMEGKKVGLLDSDFHGPSIPTLLNLEGTRPTSDGEGIIPVNFSETLKVMSMGFLLQNRDDAVIWRGPMKMKVLKQLLSDVKWGDLDYLIIDFPPGTGDEPLSIAQLIPKCDGAIIVTTPQDLSLNDVRKCINFCRQLSVPVIGVIENMSGLVCPHCGTLIDIFKTGGGEKMAREMGVPFLGKIPVEPMIVEASDSGKPFVYHYGKTEAAKAFSKAIGPVLDLERTAGTGRPQEEKRLVRPENTVRIAVPVVAGRLSPHFGHCEEFFFYDVDIDGKVIRACERLTPPAHEPGALPRWLSQNGTDIIIAGGMGSRAQEHFEENGIRVVIGAPSEEPERIVKSYLAGTLDCGDNICDH